MASPAASILSVLALLGAVYLATDPLKLSTLAGVENFHIQVAPVAPSEVLAAIPRDDANKLKAADIKLGGQIFGPESLAFDSQGRGPYAGVGDGRVMRWDGDEKGWVEFAVVIPNRTEICNQPQPLRANVEYEPVCGRPLGLRFHKQTGDLYIADAYFGLLKIGPEGGVAELLTNEGEDGQRLVFTNALDIDDDGTVYFTESSAKYGRKDYVFVILGAESGGRLSKWDPKTKKTTVLARNLFFANGVAFNKDHSFLVVVECGIGRLGRYWVKGPKAGTFDEDFAWLPGYPDNVRANDNGEFWVALHSRLPVLDGFFRRYPAIKHAFLKLPIRLSVFNKPLGAAYKFSEQGELLEVLEDQTGTVVSSLSEIEEHDGKLFLASVLLPHVAVYTLPK